ncbi:MAG TPA: drug/metabolite exporter YedA [Thermodesulfobacteriota bacterium]
MSVTGRTAYQGEAAVEASDRVDRSAGVYTALGLLYVIWGSTYLAIALAIEGFPPFLMSGIRFVVAGALLYPLLRLRGAPAPAAAEWRGAAIVGTFLLVGGNGGVAFAEQWVASGVAAVVIATTPIWTGLFAGLFGRWPSRVEWVGLGLGLAGVVLLNTGADLRAHPVGAVALLLAAVCWAFGSAWSRYLSMPSGLMAVAAQLLVGGAALILLGLAAGERLTAWPSARALWAFAYLIVVGSLVGYTAYIYLLGRVRPALATSYAYVNPVVAVALGALVAGERITGTTIVSMMVILAGVALVLVGRARSAA